MNAKRAVVAGVTGTAVMTAFLLWAPAVGLPRLAIGALLSSFLAVSAAVLYVGPAAGWVLHALIGIGLAFLYAGVFATRLPGRPITKGLLYGALVFVAAQIVFMPAVGGGFFSRGDVAMLVGSLLGHLAYGGLVGAIYGAPGAGEAGAIRVPHPTTVALVLLAAWAVPLRAQGSSGSEHPGDAPAPSDQTIDAGRSIFHGKGTCHACHGADLKGGAVAPSLRGPKWRHIDGSYTAILDRIDHGLSGTLMVAHPGDISEAEVGEVAAYVWAVSQGKAKP
jgi:mono/diheme cytochrome c family protein